MSFVYGQAYIPKSDEPDYSIPKPHYEYVIVWRDWDDVGYYMYIGDSKPRSKWKYHAKGFEELEGLMKWINTSNFYGWNNEKRTRLNDNQIIAIYDLTRAKKIKLKLHSEEIVEPYKVEAKERKWTNYEWRIKE